MTRRPLYIANWKMHKTGTEAVAYVTEMAGLMSESLVGEIILSPPTIALAAVGEALKMTVLLNRVGLAGQNVHPEPKGPYTGEVSVPMLAEHGCRNVIVGHSERRTHFGENDQFIARKVQAVLEGGLSPILCIGERLEEKEREETKAIVLNQLEAALREIPRVDGLIVAYEPVWAIGTGKNAEPADAAAVHHDIRGWISRQYGEEVASMLRILYGGSVIPENILGFMKEEDIDGALVGGASLVPSQFVQIVRNGSGTS